MSMGRKYKFIVFYSLGNIEKQERQKTVYFNKFQPTDEEFINRICSGDKGYEKRKSLIKIERFERYSTIKLI